MISTLASLDPATWATIAAGLGTAAAGLGGKIIGAREQRRKIEAGTIERITGAYGRVLNDLEDRANDQSAQLRESRADRTALHAELAMVRAQQRVELTERRTLTLHFQELVEHVRVLRTILRINQIEHPAGPAFLADVVDTGIDTEVAE